MGVGTGPLLSRARNTLLKYFLEGKEHFDYFLWADTDIVFEYEDLAVLMQCDKHIAGSVYLALGAEGDPKVVALREKQDEKGVFEDVPLSDLYAPSGEPKGPVRVDGLGCGFTLIKREVIESLRDAKGEIKRLWPYAESDEDAGYGEDLTFGLRARDLGYESFVVPRSKVGHIKEIVL